MHVNHPAEPEKHGGELIAPKLRNAALSDGGCRSGAQRRASLGPSEPARASARTEPAWFSFGAPCSGGAVAGRQVVQPERNFVSDQEHPGSVK